MKCNIFLLVILSISFNVKPIPWTSTKIRLSNISVHTIYSRRLNIKRIVQLLAIINKSMTGNPRLSMIQSSDVLCISNRMIYWFSASPKGRRPVRSGGGLLAGMWEIYINKAGLPSLKRIARNNYVKNLLFPGSRPRKTLFGADVYGGYQGNRVVWGLEHAKNVRPSKRFGRMIIQFEKGPFAADDGIFIEFEGILANNVRGPGIDSLEDTDPRPGIIGRTIYSLTYRIPLNKTEIITEVQFKPVSNNFGPINTAKLALYLPGYGSSNMVYSSNTELIKSGSLELGNVYINKYFKNSCVQKVFFYEIPFRQSQRKNSGFTSDGRGQLACVGSPSIRVPFICGYPNNDFLPKVSWTEYQLEIVDNQSLQQYGRYHGIIYNLIKSPNKSITINRGKSLIMIMRYKILPAFIPLDSHPKK